MEAQESQKAQETQKPELPGTGAGGHVPVLAREVLELLAPQPGQTVLDCTLGRGGHAALITPRLGTTGRYIGLDVDPANIAFARARLAAAPCRVDMVQTNFTQARAVLDELAVPGVDLLLADLGFSSNQMDDPSRGFTFSAAGPLDMRLDPDLPQTAADLVNHLSERELADLIHQLGEERYARRVARIIVENRRQSPILTTVELAELVRQAYGARGHQQRIDPATRTFMALRIAVNAELQALSQLLASLPRLLNSEGKAALISFHSLEDRQVKQVFAALEHQGQARRLTKKPLIAAADEVQTNPRSRSAKLRGLKMGNRIAV